MLEELQSNASDTGYGSLRTRIK